MLLHVGCVPTLVVSSADMAREMMKQHDIVFSNRPKTTAADVFSYSYRDVGFSPYGEYWRQVRKLCVLELLSAKRVESFQSVRKEHASNLIKMIKQASFNKEAINLRVMLVEVVNNIVCRCVLGEKAEECNVRLGELSRRVTSQFTHFSFGDLFPYLAWMDILTGLIARLTATHRGLESVFDSVIQQHKSDATSSGNNDFVDILVRLQKDGMLDNHQLTADNLKAILMDMIVGGIETTSTTIEWAMAELMRNPNTRKKVQEEIRRVVGKKPNIEMEDIKQIKYLNYIIKETLRLHPAAPLLLPRETSETVTLGGYHIPAKTKVLVNATAIQSDAELWDRPYEFCPDRFENNPIDYRGRDYQFIPFGGGRRGCPGITFGIASVEYLLANLLHWFDWELPDGVVAEKLDMSEENGLTVHQKIPVRVIPVLHFP
jgi:cytochrome P450